MPRNKFFAYVYLNVLVNNINIYTSLTPTTLGEYQ